VQNGDYKLGSDDEWLLTDEQKQQVLKESQQNDGVMIRN